MAFSTFIFGLKIVLAASIFFVWVVRYDNIVSEFNEYKIPAPLRDLIGIMKLTFCGILLSNHPQLMHISAGAMAVLMLAAFVTHIVFKHRFLQMVPAISLLTISCVLFLWG
ncbi:MAG: DoxX family protein [Candidatus Margulisiibacteriota bacterium]